MAVQYRLGILPERCAWSVSGNRTGIYGSQSAATLTEIRRAAGTD